MGIVGRLPRRMRHRIGDRYRPLRPTPSLQPAKARAPLDVVSRFLCTLGDAPHRAHHVSGVPTDRRLPGEHHRIGAVEHGIRHIGDLGPGRLGGRDHRFEHLRSGDDRNSSGNAQPDDAVLHVGHVLERALESEIAARHHQRVGGLDDGVEIVEGCGCLDLGNEHRPRPEGRAGAIEIGCRPDERQRHEIGFDGLQMLDELEVQSSWRGHSESRRWNVDTRTSLHEASGDDRGKRTFPVALRHGEGDSAITQGHFVALLQLRDRLVVDLNSHTRGTFAAVDQFDHVALMKTDTAVGKRGGADLWSGQITENPDGDADALGHFADQSKRRQVRGDVAVAEVEAEHVDAGGEQPGNPLVGRRRRTDGGDDLRARTPDGFGLGRRGSEGSENRGHQWALCGVVKSRPRRAFSTTSGRAGWIQY